MRSSTGVLIAVAVLLVAAGQARAQFKFGDPENLGPTVNSSNGEGGPSISADGLWLLFSSNRPGGSGSSDLWMTTRAGTEEPWQPPVNLGPPVNSQDREFAPSLAADGLTLFFSSPDRPGGFGGNDLWMTTRVSAEDPWQSPVNLGPTVNTSANDGQPNISADGLTLFFGSDRPGGFGSSDLWMTTRVSAEDPWQRPVNLGAPVNSPSGEWGTGISADGLTLFINSDRSGGFGGRDLWMTTRASVRDPWEPPVNLGRTVNSSSDDSTPDISADGRTLFFKSTRPGGYGDVDLWQVAVMDAGGCVRAPEWMCDGDVDGDGQVNPVDAGLVQAAFGSLDEQDLCNYDVDCDGQINPVDSGIVQSLFGTCEEPREVCP